MAAETQNSSRRKWLTAYAPLIVWTIVVLGLGTGMGSMNETSRFIRPLLEFLFPAASPETLTIYHGYIRKLAHFTEYAILAHLAFRALGNYRHRFSVVFGYVAAVAATDEFNQSFNMSRTSSIWDFLLDLSGGVFVIAIHVFTALRRRHRGD